MKITSGNGVFGDIVTAELRPIISLKFPYHIPSQLVSTDLTGIGAVAYDDGSAKVSTGAQTSSSAELKSRATIVYQPGQGIIARFTCVFTAGVAGSTQLIGIGDDQNGFFFGFNGASFGVVRRDQGVDDWTYAEDWFGEAARNQRNRGEVVKKGQTNFPFDQTKGNVYQIRYQWLGYGQITFSLENPETGELEDIHYIEYAGKNTDTSVHNPSFPLFLEATNTTNDTDIIMKTSSMAAFREGGTQRNLARFAQDNTKTGVSTETNIITFRSRTTFNSQTNHGRAIIDTLSIAVGGTKTATARIYLNATLGGTPSYTDIDTTESILEYDTAGTTVSGGTVLFSLALPKDGGQVFRKIEELVLDAGDSLTITVESAASTEADVAVSWREIV